MRKIQKVLLMSLIVVLLAGCNIGNQLHNRGGYNRVNNLMTQKEYESLTDEEKEEIEKLVESLDFDPNRTIDVINKALGSSIEDARSIAGALVRAGVRGVIRAELFEPEQGYTYRLEVESEENKIYIVSLTFPRWSWQEGKLVSVETIVDSETGEHIYDDGHVPVMSSPEPPDLSTFEFDVEKTVQVIQDVTNIDRDEILEAVYGFPRYSIKGAISAELVENAEEKLISVKILTEGNRYYIITFREYIDGYITWSFMDAETGEMLMG